MPAEHAATFSKALDAAHRVATILSPCPPGQYWALGSLVLESLTPNAHIAAVSLAGTFVQDHYPGKELTCRALRQATLLRMKKSIVMGADLLWTSCATGNLQRGVTYLGTAPSRAG